MIDNRYNTLRFKATDNITIHGFSGTFVTYLYKDVYLSIEPEVV